MRLRARFALTAEDGIRARRHPDRVIHTRLCFLYEVADGPAAEIDRYRLHALATVMCDLVASRDLTDRRERAQRHGKAVAIAHHELANVADGLTLGRVEHNGEVIAAATLVDLGYGHARVGSLESIEHLDGPEAPAAQGVGIQPHVQFRNPGRRIHPHAGDAVDRADQLGDLLRRAIDDVEIVAEHIHDHRGRGARNGFVDPFLEKRVDRGGETRKARQRLANPVERPALARCPHRLEVDFELGELHAGGVDHAIRAARTLCHETHARHLHQRVRDLRADAQRFGERGARCEPHVNRVVAFAQLRNKTPAHEWQ